MVNLKRDFKTIRLSITGRVITMYSNSDSLVIVHYIFDDETRARKRFMWQCELLEKGNREANNDK